MPRGRPPVLKVLHNPTALKFAGEKHSVCDPRYPFVCTTYRVTEHWQTGLQTRPQAWLLEAEPQMFCEMSEELAALRGVKTATRSGSTTAEQALGHRHRHQALQALHRAGPDSPRGGHSWHYGWRWPKDGSGGDAANLLVPSVGDPNTGIPESKAFMVNVRKA